MAWMVWLTLLILVLVTPTLSLSSDLSHKHDGSEVIQSYETDNSHIRVKRNSSRVYSFRSSSSKNTGRNSAASSSARLYNSRASSRSATNSIQAKPLQYSYAGHPSGSQSYQYSTQRSYTAQQPSYQYQSYYHAAAPDVQHIKQRYYSVPIGDQSQVAAQYYQLYASQPQAPVIQSSNAYQRVYQMPAHQTQISQAPAVQQYYQIPAPQSQVIRVPGRQIQVAEATQRFVQAPAHKFIEAPARQVIQSPAPQVVQAPTPQVIQAPAPEIIQAHARHFIQAPAPQVIQAPAPQVIQAPARHFIQAPAPQVIQTPVRQVIQAPAHQVIHAPAPQVIQAPARQVIQASAPRVSVPALVPENISGPAPAPKYVGRKDPVRQQLCRHSVQCHWRPTPPIVVRPQPPPCYNHCTGSSGCSSSCMPPSPPIVVQPTPHPIVVRPPPPPIINRPPPPPIYVRPPPPPIYVRPPPPPIYVRPPPPTIIVRPPPPPIYVRPPPPPIYVRPPPPPIYVRPPPPPIIQPPPPPIAVQPPPVTTCPTTSCSQSTCGYTAPALSTCHSHSNCGAGNRCCYNSHVGSTTCTAGVSRSVKTQRHLQVTNTGSGEILVVLEYWLSANMSELLSGLVLPLKMELGHRLEVHFATALTQLQIEVGCDLQDADCLGSKTFTCALEEELNATSSIYAAEISTVDTTNISTDDTTTDTQNEEIAESGVDQEGSSHHNSLPDESQIRLLSFSACLMQSFRAGMVEKKKSALLAAKKCVRSHQYNWNSIRTCVWDGVQPLPAEQQVDTSEQQDPELHLLNMKQSLCGALEEEGVASILCDLVFDDVMDAVDTATAIRAAAFEEEEEEKKKEEEEEEPTNEGVHNEVSDDSIPEELFGLIMSRRRSQ